MESLDISMYMYTYINNGYSREVEIVGDLNFFKFICNF